MSRAFLAVTAGLLCALLGLRSASRLRREAGRMRRWTELLAHLALLLEEGALPIPEALQTASDGTNEADGLLREIAQRMQSDPMTTPEAACRGALPGGWAEGETLLRMFRRLGHGAGAGRVQAVRQADAAVMLLAEQFSERARRDAKVYTTLGWTGGACLTLLLL